jgi:glycosidase
MPWNGSANHGFTTAEPWLEVVVPTDGTADQQAHDPGSMLAWYRELMALRRQLQGDVELIDAASDLVAFRRGTHVIALNLGAEPQAPPAARDLLLATPLSNLVAVAPSGAIVARD